MNAHANVTTNGDLNNIHAARPNIEIKADLAYLHRSLAITESDDDIKIRRKYRPFLLGADVDDWVAKLELSTVMKMAEQDLERTGERLKVLVLFGSLRRRLVALLYICPLSVRRLHKMFTGARQILLSVGST